MLEIFQDCFVGPSVHFRILTSVLMLRLLDREAHSQAERQPKMKTYERRQAGRRATWSMG